MHRSHVEFDGYHDTVSLTPNAFIPRLSLLNMLSDTIVDNTLASLSECSTYAYRFVKSVAPSSLRSAAQKYIGELTDTKFDEFSPRAQETIREKPPPKPQLKIIDLVSQESYFLLTPRKLSQFDEYVDDSEKLHRTPTRPTDIHQESERGSRPLYLTLQIPPT